MSLPREKVVYDAVLGYGPPQDRPWIISHEYEVQQDLALEEVHLKRYRRLLGPESAEPVLSYADRLMWATSVEADCEGHAYDGSKPSGVDAVFQIMSERCLSRVRVDLLLRRKDARLLPLPDSHPVDIREGPESTVRLRGTRRRGARGPAPSVLTYREWREILVRQEAYNVAHLGLVRRAAEGVDADDEDALVWIASTMIYPKSSSTATVLAEAFAGLRALGIIVSTAVAQPYTKGIYYTESRNATIGGLLSYRDPSVGCSVVPIQMTLAPPPPPVPSLDARHVEMFEKEMAMRIKRCKRAAVIYNMALGMDDGVLYLPDFFTDESLRLRKHCIHGFGETKAIRRKLLLTGPSTGTLKFELFEHEFYCLKERGVRNLTLAERFCSFIALILAMWEDSRWLMENQCTDEIRRFFVEISKFSKHSLRISDDQLGFGLTSSTDDRRRYEILDSYKRSFATVGQKFNWRPGKPKSDAWKQAQSTSQRDRYKRARVAAECDAMEAIELNARRAAAAGLNVESAATSMHGDTESTDTENDHVYDDDVDHDHDDRDDDHDDEAEDDEGEYDGEDDWDDRHGGGRVHRDSWRREGDDEAAGQDHRDDDDDDVDDRGHDDDHDDHDDDRVHNVDGDESDDGAAKEVGTQPVSADSAPAASATMNVGPQDIQPDGDSGKQDGVSTETDAPMQE